MTKRETVKEKRLSENGAGENANLYVLDLAVMSLRLKAMCQ